MMATRSFNLLLLLLVLLAVAQSQTQEEELRSQTCLVDGTCTTTSQDGEYDGDDYGEFDSEDEYEDDEEYYDDECIDEEEECEFWAGLEPSECDVNPDYMHNACPRACGICEEIIDLGVEQNMYKHDMVVSRKIEMVVNKTWEYMEDVVMVDPKYEAVRGHCKNQDEECSYWASIGECENNAGFMESTCAPACRSCDKLTYESRCPMDNLGPDAWGPGDMYKMFERIVSEAEFKQYEPRILSRPSYPEGETEETADYKIGPWVVVLENFATPEECERLIELGHELGYERSVDVGELHFDGTFDDDINDGRTSTNSWCEGICADDPAAQAVNERIENVTGIPQNNSEQLQLLRYEENQYYNEHHDYIDFHKDRQVGVRLMTLYIYLNDVEEGGGTRFPELDLTVQPKRGSALLWPSVLNEEPDEIDESTEHQALPVTKGIKYGANAWLHQRDFKTPNEEGCA